MRNTTRFIRCDPALIMRPQLPSESSRFLELGVLELASWMWKKSPRLTRHPVSLFGDTDTSLSTASSNIFSDLLTSQSSAPVSSDQALRPRWWSPIRYTDIRSWSTVLGAFSGLCMPDSSSLNASVNSSIISWILTFSGSWMCHCSLIDPSSPYAVLNLLVVNPGATCRVTP